MTDTETELEIDAENPEDAEDYLFADFKDEVDAITDLNFEKAKMLTQKKYQYLDDETENEKAHYEEQAQILEQQNYEDYNAEIGRISQDYLQNAEYYKNLWQEYCKALVDRHHQEAEELEQKWRDARNLQYARTAQQAHASLGTARMLASCEQFDQAIEIRDAAQETISNINSPDLQKIDIDFTQRYQHMIKRHFAEYQYLHRHLKSLMKTLREKANAQKKTAESNLQVEQARNTTLILETVVKESVSMKAKDSLIQSFSPRSRQQDRPISKARSYALHMSPRSIISRASTTFPYSGRNSPKPTSGRASPKPNISEQ